MNEICLQILTMIRFYLEKMSFWSKDQLNAPMYSTKCDVEEIVFLPDSNYCRPASQSPDISAQEFDDDSLDDEMEDDRYEDNRKSSMYLKTPIKTEHQTCSVDRSPFVFLRAPGVNGECSSMAADHFLNENSSNVNENSPNSNVNSFDPFVSNVFKTDANAMKSIRQTITTRFLSAPVSSTAPENVAEEPIRTKEQLLRAPTDRRTSPSTSNNDRAAFHCRNEAPPLQNISSKTVSSTYLPIAFEPHSYYDYLLNPIVSGVQPYSVPSYRYTAPSLTTANNASFASSMNFVPAPFLSSRNSVDPLPLSMVARRTSCNEANTERQLKDHANLMSTSTTMKFIDTHCHLDMVFTKDNFDSDFSLFKKKFKSTWSPKYTACITDFCCPATFSNNSQFFEQILSNDDVYAAIGCHPLEVRSYDGDTESIILAKATHPKVVAVGELGLDYSSKTEVKGEKETQKVILERQLMLSIREINKPILLHCRDADDDCLSIMKRLVPHDFPIHWHCFSGSIASAKKWDMFSNMYFGVTTGIYDCPSKDTLDFAKNFPLDRLLIETDAPYFLPAHYRTGKFGKLEYSHPGLGGLVAIKLAEMRSMPEELIFEQLYNNTLRIYSSLSS